MAKLKCDLLIDKDVFKDAFKHKRSYDDYHLEKLNDSVYLTNSKSPYLFWANDNYPLVITGDGRKTNLTKIGKFPGGMGDVVEALDVMCFLLTSENVYVLHLDPYSKELYRTMVPRQRTVTVPSELRGLKTMDELKELREVKRKEHEDKRESEKIA